ncbi:hypothetical protein QYM41_04650 [Kocuria sp. CPCC 205268]|uniref:hypothetical protein n=1 Tax=Kocuria oxytropis TaxID=3058913 RepID=UPI0034D3F522
MGLRGIFRKNTEDSTPRRETGRPEQPGGPAAGPAGRRTDAPGTGATNAVGQDTAPGRADGSGHDEHGPGETRPLPEHGPLPYLVDRLTSRGADRAVLTLVQRGNTMTHQTEQSVGDADPSVESGTVDQDSPLFDPVADLYSEAMNSPRGAWQTARIEVGPEQDGVRPVVTTYGFADGGEDVRTWRSGRPTPAAAGTGARPQTDGAERGTDGPSAGGSPSAGSGTAGQQSAAAPETAAPGRDGADSGHGPERGTGGAPAAAAAAGAAGAAGSSAAGSAAEPGDRGTGEQPSVPAPEGPAAGGAQDGPGVREPGAPGGGAVRDGLGPDASPGDGARHDADRPAGAQPDDAPSGDARSAGTRPEDAPRQDGAHHDVPDHVDHEEWHEDVEPAAPTGAAAATAAAAAAGTVGGDEHDSSAPETAVSTDVSPSYRAPEGRTGRPSQDTLAEGNLVLKEVDVLRRLGDAQRRLFGENGTAMDVSTVLVRVRALGTYYDALTHVRKNGFWDQRRTFDLIPEELLHVQELKDESYVEGSGAPLAMMFRFRPGIPPEVSFDYADEEAFVRYEDRLPAQNYLEELRMYPRTGAHIPQHMNEALQDWNY